MKKFVFASFCTFALVGFVTADEFQALVTKIDGTTVTYYKMKLPEGKKFGGEKDGPELKATVTAKAKFVKAKFDPDTKALVAGEDWENGLKNDLFAKIDAEKGLNVTLTIEDKGADKGKISQIMAFGGGKGGKKAGGKAGKGGN